jgi:hypothetical protein
VSSLTLRFTTSHAEHILNQMMFEVADASGGEIGASDASGGEIRASATSSGRIRALVAVVLNALEIPRPMSSRSFPVDDVRHWNAWYAYHNATVIPRIGIAAFIAYVNLPPDEREATRPDSGAIDEMPVLGITVTSDTSSTSTLSNAPAAGMGPGREGQETVVPPVPVHHVAADQKPTAGLLQPTGDSRSLLGVSLVQSLTTLDYSNDSTPQDVIEQTFFAIMAQSCDEVEPPGSIDGSMENKPSALSKVKEDDDEDDDDDSLKDDGEKSKQKKEPTPAKKPPTESCRSDDNKGEKILDAAKQSRMYRIRSSRLPQLRQCRQPSTMATTPAMTMTTTPPTIGTHPNLSTNLRSLVQDWLETYCKIVCAS